MGFGKYFAGGLALYDRCVYSCLHKPTKGNTMNTMTAEKEITFTLFYRNNRKPGMIDIKQATAAVADLALTEGWEFKTWTVDRFGRNILASARKPSYTWEAVAHRAGIEL